MSELETLKAEVASLWAAFKSTSPVAADDQKQALQRQWSALEAQRVVLTQKRDLLRSHRDAEARRAARDAGARRALGVLLGLISGVILMLTWLTRQ